MSTMRPKTRRPAHLDVNDEDSDRAEFERLLAEADSGTPTVGRPTEPQVGERVKGKIVAVGESTVFVDLGSGSEGVLDLAEVQRDDGTVEVAVGDMIEAVIAARDTASRGYVLRRRGGSRPGEASLELRQARELGLPVEGVVRSVNKGGIEVEVGGQTAFCPFSQIDVRPVGDAADWVGKRLSFVVTRIEEGGRGRPVSVVVSRRELLERESRERAAAVRARLEPGSVVRGKVSSIASYGAFIDLGGLDGLLHVSELGHGRVENPADVLAVGEEVEVQVLRIDPAKDDKRGERISLSMKALQRDPWKEAATRFPIGSDHPGRVMRLESFGAFVQLAPGLEGLLHVSEIGAGRRLAHAREALALGQDVRVRVLDLDLAKRRIGLHLLSDRPGGETESDDWRGRLAPAGSGFGSLGDALRRDKKP